METKERCPETFDGQDIEFIDAGRYSTEHTESLENLFANCKNLKRVDLRGFETSHIKDMSGMFQGCEQLEDVDLSFLDTTSVEMMDDMFRDCKSLKHISLCISNNSTFLGMDGLFDGCESLETIEMSGIYLEDYDCSRIFKGCNRLNKIILNRCSGEVVEKILHAYWGTFFRYIDIETDNADTLKKLSLHCDCGDLADKELSPLTTGPENKFFTDLAAYTTAIYGLGNSERVGVGMKLRVGMELAVMASYPLYCEVGQEFSSTYGFDNMEYVTFRLEKIIFQHDSKAIVEVQIVKIGSFKDFLKPNPASSSITNYYKNGYRGPDGEAIVPFVIYNNPAKKLFCIRNSWGGGDIVECHAIYIDNSGLDHLVKIECSDFHVHRADFGDLILGPHSDCPWLDKLELPDLSFYS